MLQTEIRKDNGVTIQREQREFEDLHDIHRYLSEIVARYKRVEAVYSYLGEVYKLRVEA